MKTENLTEGKKNFLLPKKFLFNLCVIIITLTLKAYIYTVDIACVALEVNYHKYFISCRYFDVIGFAYVAAKIALSKGGIG